MYGEEEGRKDNFRLYLRCTVKYVLLKIGEQQ